METRGNLNEIPGNHSSLCDPMIGSRSHNQSNRDCQQEQGNEVKNLLRRRKILETIIKDRNKLKTKKGLDPGKNHSGFLDHGSGFFFEARWSSYGLMVFG